MFPGPRLPSLTIGSDITLPPKEMVFRNYYIECLLAVPYGNDGAGS